MSIYLNFSHLVRNWVEPGEIFWVLRKNRWKWGGIVAGKSSDMFTSSRGSASSRYVMLRSCCSLLNCEFLLQAHSVFIFSRPSWEAQFPSLEYVQCCFSCEPYFPRSCANLAKSNRNTHNFRLSPHIFTTTLLTFTQSNRPVYSSTARQRLRRESAIRHRSFLLLLKSVPDRGFQQHLR